MYILEELTKFFLESYKNPNFKINEHFTIETFQEKKDFQSPENIPKNPKLYRTLKIFPKNNKNLNIRFEIYTKNYEEEKEKLKIIRLCSIKVFINDKIFDILEDIDQDDCYEFLKKTTEKFEENTKDFRFYAQYDDHQIYEHYDLFFYFFLMWRASNPYSPFILMQKVLNHSAKTETTNHYEEHLKKILKSEDVKKNIKENKNFSLKITKKNTSSHLTEDEIEDNIILKSTALYNVSFKKEEKIISVDANSNAEQCFEILFLEPIRSQHEKMNILKKLEEICKNFKILLKNTQYENHINF